MNQQEFEFMNDLARAFERRYRDTRSLNRCLSIEGRYMGEEACPHKPEIGLRYGEDAMFLTLQAWAKVDAPQQEAVRISFGIGAKSQAAYEERLQAEIRRRGEACICRRIWAWPRGTGRYGRRQGMILICCLRRFDFLFGCAMIVEINTS